MFTPLARRSGFFGARLTAAAAGWLNVGRERIRCRCMTAALGSCWSARAAVGGFGLDSLLAEHSKSLTSTNQVPRSRLFARSGLRRLHLQGYGHEDAADQVRGVNRRVHRQQPVPQVLVELIDQFDQYLRYGLMTVDTPMDATNLVSRIFMPITQEVQTA